MLIKDLLFRYETEKAPETIDKIFEISNIRNRELLLNDITSEVADNIDGFIRFYNNIDDEQNVPKEDRKPIKIYINSYGGSVTASFQILDSISLSKTPIWTINVGCAYSSGLEIFMAGHRRFSYPLATFLFHEGASAFEGDANKFRNYALFYDLLLKKSKANVLKFTKLTEEEYDKHSKDDWWFMAEEAVEKGFCDEIVKDFI